MHRIFTKLNMKRLFAAVMAAVMITVLCVPCMAAETDACGNGLTWSYSNGTLTIRGSGAMYHYSQSRPAPWYNLAENIRIIKVESGVTSVGAYAFYNCSALTSVTLPNTVLTIGRFAFADCYRMKTASLGNGLTEIGEGAFENCEALQTIRLPQGLRKIGARAFYHCSSLKTVSVPASVTEMGKMVFSYCATLVTAEVRASISELPLWSFYGCALLSDLTLGEQILAVGDKALSLCDELCGVYYLGNEANGKILYQDLVKCVPYFRESLLTCAQKDTNTSSAVNITVKEDNVLVVDRITVSATEHAVISTTVSEERQITEEGQINILDSNVTVSAVIDHEDGWNDLAAEILAAEEKGGDDMRIGVEVNVNGETQIAGEVLDELTGKKVDIKVESSDGSSVKINCERLTTETTDSNYMLSYTMTKNEEPTEKETKLFGNAESYLLNFTGDSTLDYSPSIYVGTDNSHKCAVLYQEIEGKYERVQSAIIDRNGYATFYLGQTLSTVQYHVGIDVAGEKRSDAIIPDEMAVDLGVIEMYEPIQYVVTGERLFMGLNIAQFSYIVFGVIGAMAVAIGTIMAIVYRKKRLELLYRMKMEDENRM